MANMESDNSRDSEGRGISRKDLFKVAAAAAPIPALLGGGTALAREQAASGRVLEPTPYCDDGDEPTPRQTEGPYFTPGSPQRTNLVEPGMSGTRLNVSGYVFGITCIPVANALLDFWQCDTYGQYDNYGYTLRGHQYTDQQGAFDLDTIVPGLYPGRTRHIHVKVQAPNEPILTTQLYFPGEPRNRTDTIFDPRLLMNMRTGGPGQEGTYDFVLRVRQDDDGDDDDNPPDDQGTWQAGTSYQVGDTVTYGGSTYRCQIAHTAIVGWEPPNTPALWQAV